MFAAVLLLSGCATLQLNARRQPSLAFASDKTGQLWRTWSATLGEHPGLSGFMLLPSGVDAFASRVTLADQAQHSLDVQYYMIHSDTTGKLLLDRFLAAADRGVRVRILIDDLHAFESDEQVASLNLHANFEIRVFNPWRWRNNPIASGLESLLDSGRINHRMHNKLMVADSVAMVVGGRNLGDEYFQFDPDLDFRDLDVFVVGPVVQDATRVFDAFWNSEWAVSITARADLSPSAAELARVRATLAANRDAMALSKYVTTVNAAPIGAELRQGTAPLNYATARVIADPPEKVRTSGRKMRAEFMIARFNKVIPGAQHELLISSPYLVPDLGGIQLLAGLVRRGVRVRILTNSFLANDMPAVHSGYAHYRRDLLRAGVELCEVKRAASSNGRERVRERGFGSANSSLHTKAFVIDRRFVFIGSLNIDPRSLLRNTEDGLIIDSPPLAEETARLLLRAMAPQASYEVRLRTAGKPDLIWITTEEGRRVQVDREPGIGFWQRLTLLFYRLLPLESEI